MGTKYLKNLFLLSLLLVLSSCLISDGIKVEVQNLSSTIISDVKIYIGDNESSQVKLGQLDPSERKRGFLDMTEVTTDGAYSISFKRVNEDPEAYGVGYFTNGAPLDRKVTFIIEADTVLVEFQSIY